MWPHLILIKPSEVLSHFYWWETKAQWGEERKVSWMLTCCADYSWKPRSRHYCDVKWKTELTAVKVEKTDFIQDYCNRGKETSYRTGLNSEYSVVHWQLVAKEQGGAQWVETYSEDTSGVRGFWLKTDQGDETSPGRWWRVRILTIYQRDQTWR